MILFQIQPTSRFAITQKYTTRTMIRRSVEQCTEQYPMSKIVVLLCLWWWMLTNSYFSFLLFSTSSSTRSNNEQLCSYDSRIIIRADSSRLCPMEVQVFGCGYNFGAKIARKPWINESSLMFFVRSFFLFVLFAWIVAGICVCSLSRIVSVFCSKITNVQSIDLQWKREREEMDK